MIIPSSYPFSQSSSSSSAMPNIDLNIEDNQSHDLILISPTHQPSNSSSNSSLSSSSYPNFLFNPPSQSHHHAGSSSFYCQQNHFQTQQVHLQGDHEKIIVGGRGLWEDPAENKEEGERKRGLKLKVWKKKGSSNDDDIIKELEEDHQNDQKKKKNNDDNHDEIDDLDNINNNIIDDSVKWMPSKMRIMRKMMANSVSAADHKGHNKFEDQNQNQKLMSPIGTDNSSSNSCSNNNITIRVCADCHTTKTPLWRSGPRGPKSLCNACGIRQRKARRAMAAAAAATGNGPATTKMETSGGYKHLEKKENKSSKMECERELKKKKKKRKKRKHNNNNGGEEGNNNKEIGGIRGRKKFRFEDLAVRLSKKLGPLSQVFPQDEKEAAILLMALSYNYHMDDQVHFS